MSTRMHDDELDIDDALVRALLREQMPQWADLSIERVVSSGTDNAMFRLGDELVVRLPRIGWAAGQIAREATWLPQLAPLLPVAVPEPVAVALDLAESVRRLQTAPTERAPRARNRARPLQDYDDATRQAIAAAAHLIDAAAATAVWEEALAAGPHTAPPVWVQGDLEGNCLVRDGRLCGIVDWGSACAGDPAVDVQVVWSPLFTDDSRRAFLDALDVDAATLARSRGAAINQACAALPYYLHTYPLIVERSWHKLATLGVRPRV